MSAIIGYEHLDGRIQNYIDALESRVKELEAENKGLKMTVIGECRGCGADLKVADKIYSIYGKLVCKNCSYKAPEQLA